MADVSQCPISPIVVILSVSVKFPAVVFPAVVFCPCAIIVFREPVIKLGKIAAFAIVTIVIITNMLIFISRVN
jgi:hypothetical protein